MGMLETFAKKTNVKGIVKSITMSGNWKTENTVFNAVQYYVQCIECFVQYSV